MKFERFLLAYFLVLLATLFLVALLPKPFEPDQERFVDLEDLLAHIEDFSGGKIRTIGTVRYCSSFFQYEDFWLVADEQDSGAIPVVVKAELTVPSENASVEVSGTIEYTGFGEGFFYFDSSSWIPAENIVYGRGTVTFLDFEGGFYGIVSDDGEAYDPRNLDREFQVDGLRVFFEATILRKTGNVHGWGKVVSIRYIEKLE